MDRVRWDALDDRSVSSYDLDGVDAHMSLEELRELNKKSADILGSLVLNGYESRAFAEKIFRLGYLAAHVKIVKT